MKKAGLSCGTETKQLLENNNIGGSYLQSVKGIIAAFSVVILYTASATSVQLLERRIPDLELNASRSGIPLIFHSIGLLVMKKRPIIERSQIGGTLLYSLVGSSSTMSEFVSVTFLPAATTSCVFSTSTIIIGLLLFTLCLKESFTVKKLLFAAMCVCGVILVVLPWTKLKKHREGFDDGGHISLHGSQKYLPKLAGHVNSTDNSGFEARLDYPEVNVSGKPTTLWTSTVNFTKTFTGTVLFSEIIGYTTAVAGGILLASEVIIVKRYSYIHEHILETTFWGWSTGTTVSLVLMLATATPVLPGNWFDIVMVIIHSCTCAAIWPLAIYLGNTIAGNTSTLIMSTQVVFMLASQYTVLSSILPGNRNWMEVVGLCERFWL